MKTRLSPFVASFAILVSAQAASAETVILETEFLSMSGTPFWTWEQSFDLPATAADPVLSITRFSANDRAVLQLNGTSILSVGIGGPGQGRFHFANTGPAIDWTFSANGDQTFSTTTGFVTGTNVVRLILNNTQTGIGGDGRDLFGAAFAEVEGTVTFRRVGGGGTAPGVIPEPATWAMMIAGFGLVGGMMRRRGAAVA